MKNCLLLLVILLIPAWLFPQQLCGTNSIAVIRDENGIMTDAQQREAFTQLFTSEGVSQMLNSLKEEAKATLSDGDRLTHFGSRTVIEVASAVSGFSIISGTKVGEILSGTGESLKKFLNPDLAGKIDNLMNQSKYLPDIKNALKDFFREMDPKLLDKLANIDNFDEVVKEMAQGWKKFHGEEFVLEHIGRQSDEFIAGIKAFEAKIDDAANYTADIKLKPDALHPKGLSLEYKSWKKNTFSGLMKGNQFKNQLKNYIKDGDFEYIINKQKLLGDGVLDPDAFVKGEFQKVFKENADNWIKAIEDGGELLNKTQLRKLFGTDDIDDIIDIINDINKPFYNIIKIE
jgi:hypothetical protein